MAAEKLRIVFHEGKDGVKSYIHLEKSEGLRVIAILRILPKLDKWTPASKIAKMINAKLPATLSTLYKLAGAGKIDLKLSEGRKTIHKSPILHIRKEKFNRPNNIKKAGYLRSTVYVRKHIRK